MENLIRDFTEFFEFEKIIVQHEDVKDKTASLLSLLNTHNMIVDGGVDLYIQKEGYKKIDLKDILGYDILDYNDLAFFIYKRLTNIAEEAFGQGDEIKEVAIALHHFSPDDPESVKKLEDLWLENKELIQNLIYLYSEYLYKVFLNNPFNKAFKNKTEIKDIDEI